jgi:hypothetical protein
MPSRAALSLIVIGCLSYLWLALTWGYLENNISSGMTMFGASFLERLMFS